MNARRAVAVGLALVSAFWVFYEGRLLVVTHGLTQLRAGGNGAYIGAVVFPLFAIAAGWGAVRLWKRNGVSRG